MQNLHVTGGHKNNNSGPFGLQMHANLNQEVATRMQSRGENSLHACGGSFKSKVGLLYPNETWLL